MHGNVIQWCQDWYGKYPQKDAVDPQGPNAENGRRVMRGGLWEITHMSFRSAFRYAGMAPDGRKARLGFRLCFFKNGEFEVAPKKEPGDAEPQGKPMPTSPELVADSKKKESPPPASEAKEKAPRDAAAPGFKTKPFGLQYLELKSGTGKDAKLGDMVTVHYTGTLENGKKFDSSLDRNQPSSFLLDYKNATKGFVEGVIGMKEGGKRTLIIPPRPYISVDSRAFFKKN